jgi:hypothetical protein
MFCLVQNMKFLIFIGFSLELRVNSDRFYQLEE